MPPVPSAMRFRIDPRDLPPEKIARRLGLSVEAFEGKLARLVERGFPPADPDTGNFDLKAVEAWMDRRSGLTAGADGDHSRDAVRSRLEAWDGGGRGR